MGVGTCHSTGVRAKPIVDTLTRTLVAAVRVMLTIWAEGVKWVE